ncbi:universal stress protein [Vibrio rumoiensis]|uniref:Universal stress protein n=1 Tax=Vibrio rumoiensis 1S-45 TaxID=1188252 RepID=A0A1E5E6P9_9VIBR|nr:universal stress protein [Vibrio rumoiensis]OEF30019.1 universal stress global response regulator UspA [Vibrio rumoiensis 1S-45]
MTYKHILVAVDLSEDSTILIKKASKLAQACNAQLSLIHIDVNFTDMYTGFMEINFAETQNAMLESAQKKIKTLVEEIDFPITETIVSSGDLCNEISHSIETLHVDLVICGHHKDFWSKLLSTSRQLINNAAVDMLIVPLED